MNEKIYIMLDTESAVIFSLNGNSRIAQIWTLIFQAYSQNEHKDFSNCP